MSSGKFFTLTLSLFLSDDDFVFFNLQFHGKVLSLMCSRPSCVIFLLRGPRLLSRHGRTLGQLQVACMSTCAFHASLDASEPAMNCRIIWFAFASIDFYIHAYLARKIILLSALFLFSLPASVLWRLSRFFFRTMLQSIFQGLTATAWSACAVWWWRLSSEHYQRVSTEGNVLGLL